jgi:hypothetical protein
LLSRLLTGSVIVSVDDRVVVAVEVAVVAMVVVDVTILL